VKVAIVGSRDYPDLFQVHSYLDYHLSEREAMGDPTPYIIVSGGAKGVDTEAVEYAKRAWNVDSIVFLADWSGHGKRAGFIRNRQIVNEADHVVAFWDGVSRGTKHTIDLTLAARKNLEVVFP
jgi:hypothetical protein